MSTGEDIIIWIVEDDRIYLESMKMVLSQTDHMRCAQIFSDIESLKSILSDPPPGQVLPDVLLLDIHLPGANGVDALPALKESMSHTSIVMLTIAEDAQLIYSAFQRGASGYLIKDAPVEKILYAIGEASRGGTVMPPEVAKKVMRFFQSQNFEQPDYDLTEREKEVLEYMSKGFSQKQIAGKLYLSPYTVNSHIQNIYTKLQVHSGIEAVAKAIRERIV